METSNRGPGLASGLGVLIGGGITLVLALAGVWMASRSGENIMGWYADYVLPVGAVLVGLVASSGFCIASYVSGTKVTGLLMLAVVGMLLAGYLAAQYVEFLLLIPSGAEIGFFDYYDSVTRSFHWVEHGTPGSPMGSIGYLLRAGETLGFVGGGVLIPIALRRLPYCEACAAYMRSPVVARIPAGVAWKNINAKRHPEEAQRQTDEANQAFENANTKLKAILAASKDAGGFTQAIADNGPKGQRSTDKLSARIWVHLVHCRRCAGGELRATS
jgi:hypothetical protein